MNVKAQNHNLDSALYRCEMLLSGYLFGFCLISTALRYFGHVSDCLGIYSFGFDLSFGFCHLKLYGNPETIPGKAEGL